MSHTAQLNFVERLSKEFPEHFNKAKVIEIGSLDINGSVRGYFADCEYIGVDVGEGKNVDLVCEGQKVDHPDGTYDTSLSCNCFEHNPHWVETFRNMHRMTKKDGLVFGECKTYGLFQKKDFDRMSYLAKSFPGAILVFSTLRKTLTLWQLKPKLTPPVRTLKNRPDLKHLPEKPSSGKMPSAMASLPSLP